MFETFVDKLLQRWLAANVLAATEGDSHAARFFGLSRSTVIRVGEILDEDGPEALRARAERSTRRDAEYIAALQREMQRIAREHPDWGRYRITDALNARGYTSSTTAAQQFLDRNRTAPNDQRDSTHPLRRPGASEPRQQRCTEHDHELAPAHL